MKKFVPMDISLEKYYYKKIITISSVLNKKFFCIDELRRISWGGIPQCLRPLCWRILLENIGESKSSRADEFKTRKEKFYNNIKYNLLDNETDHNSVFKLIEDKLTTEIIHYRKQNKNIQHIIDNYKNIVENVINKKQEYEVLFKDLNFNIKDNNNVNTLDMNIKEDNILFKDNNSDLNDLSNRIKNTIDNIHRKLLRLNLLFEEGGIKEEDSNLFFIDKKIFHQIFIDIKRIGSHYRIKNNKNLDFLYLEVLINIAESRPVVGYVQGMADLLVPFIEVLYSQEEIIYCSNSSIFYCYSKIIEKIQDNFIDQQQGIYDLVCKLEKLIKILDPEMYYYLKKTGIEIHMFSFRWFNCIFAREFSLENHFIILDTLFSNKNFKDFLLHFSFSLISHFKDDIIGEDFSTIILFLQNIRQRRWTHNELLVLFSKTYINQEIFGDTNIEKYFK